ncbi:MAG: BMP family ABC transporter substrate-binding protein [Oscillospiraceae bacterium]|nr:BMP family ABC transporter substrate-binding protein [Oscillospiraceae bacterium]
MKIKKLTVILFCLLYCSVILAGCGGAGSTNNSTAAGGGITVGFIYIGPVGDAGWTTAHDNGRKYLEANLPGCKTLFVENVPESADSERVMTELINKGCKVIFATSFGYMDYVLNVAAKFPNVTFMHCSGYKTAANAGTYFGQIEQPRYLSGIVAGEMTKANKIGYVAAFPIPECIRGINFFTQGVRSVNPNATVKVIWTNTWYDPAKEKDAAVSLLDAGCDVIAQHQDTPGPQQAAQDRGAFSIGYNTDMSSFAPNANLTSPIWNWGPYYVKTVQAVMNGTWKNDQYWGSIADGVVDIAPLTKLVPDNVKTDVTGKRQQMIDGTLNIFQGPIKDQSGAVKVADGQKMTEDEVLNMNWFVEGVDGTIPK